MGGRENFDKPDPLVGKSQAMAKDISYMRETLKLCSGKGVVLDRFCARLKSFISMQSVYVRLLMPSWMERKVFTNVLTYIPPEHGGLGLTLPFDVDIKSSEKARSLAARHSTKYSNPRFQENKVEWERGVRISNVVINKLVVKEDLSLLTENEAKEIARSEIESRAASANVSIGNFSLYKEVERKFICLSREIPLVNSKENAYVKLSIHPETKLDVVRKMRCRQLLGKITKDLLSYDELPNFDWQKPRRNDLYVRSDQLKSMLQTGFVTPDLKIHRGLFETSIRKYPKWVQNVESVRDAVEAGSFDEIIDERPESRQTESSDS